MRSSIGLHAAAAGLVAATPSDWRWSLGAVALNQAVLAGAGLSPRSTLLGPNLRRLPCTGRAEVALTFDDGPDPEVTPRVLDLLDRHGAKASFFCIGAQARAHPAVLREIARRGHAVENHTDRHLYRFAALSPGGLRREVDAAQATLADLAGTPPVFFRAPMGLRSPLLEPLLASRGLLLVSWTRRALDGLFGEPRAAGARLRRGLGPGDVLLLHDGRAARTGQGGPVVLAVLPGLLAALEGQGLRSVTLRTGVAGNGPVPSPEHTDFDDPEADFPHRYSGKVQ